VTFGKAVLEDWRRDYADAPNYGPIELEVARFYKCYVELNRPNLILESGTRDGFSTLSLAAGLQTLGRGKIYTLDADVQNHLFQGLSVEKHIVFLRGAVGEISLESLPDGERTTFDLLVLDGDHRYGGVVAEINRYAPMLRVGGGLILYNSMYFDGVGLAVRALMNSAAFEVSTMQTPRRHGRNSRCPGLTIARKTQRVFGNVIAADPQSSDVEASLPGRSDDDPAVLDAS
jgi:predicted O-methyltransferase YrrM